MSPKSLQSLEPISVEAIVGRSPRQIAWMRFKRNKVGVGAAMMSIAILMLSLCAPIVAKVIGVDPDTLNLDVLDVSGIPTVGISWDHPLG